MCALERIEVGVSLGITKQVKRMIRKYNTSDVEDIIENLVAGISPRSSFFGRSLHRERATEYSEAVFTEYGNLGICYK